MALLLMSMMVPMATLLIPRYRMFAKWGLLNTFLSVILPSVATAFLIFFFRQNTKSFSKEILQAARVDGLGEMKSFFLIYCPVMRSTFAAATIITFMNIWNSYLWPLVALQTDDKMTLPLIRLHTGLRNDHGSHRNGNLPDRSDFLHHAEELRRRDAGLR